jgi:hypothetical protein
MKKMKRRKKSPTCRTGREDEELPLTLLMLRVLADNPENAATSNHPA